MIIDTSALLAVLLNEADAARYREAIADHESRLISVANYVEAGLRLAYNRSSPIPLRQLDALVQAASLQLEPVSAEQGRLAIEAFRDFGKGSGSPAQLNYGDCFAYALARHTGQPLLFKGDDFTHTDIEAALP